MQWKLAVPLVLAALASAIPAHADTDLVAHSLDFRQAGGVWLATLNMTAMLDADTPDYEFKITLEQRRNGSLIRTWVVDDNPVVHGANCNTCVYVCGGNCQFLVLGKQFDGTCVNNGDKTCPGSPPTRKCICSANDPKAIRDWIISQLESPSAQAGDVFTATVVAKNGIVELSTANNTTSATF